MMNRRNQILSGILILQIALIAVVFWPGRGANASAAPIFGAITVDDIQAITVHEGEKRIRVARSGDGWVLPDAGDFPVTAVSATDTISKLLTINTSRLVASNTASHARLQVDEEKAVRRVDLETKDGETLGLIVGSSPSFRATNVRRADSNDVYLTGDIQATDLRTDYGSWINTTYVAIPNADANAITLTNSNGTLTFTRVNTDTWTLADLAASETFNQNNLTSLLTRVSGLNMVKPLGKEVKPEYGMDAPQATLTIVHGPADGESKTTTLTIGAKDAESNNYVVKSSDSEYYVEVASFSAEDVVTRGRADYLQEPEATGAVTATNGLTATDFISGFGLITDTAGITGTQAATTTETVTP